MTSPNGSNGLGDLMRDPDETIRRMDDWAAGFAAKAERYQAAQAETERLRLTATSGDGAVSVTVGADGTVTDLTFSNKVKSFPLEELSRAILTTMRRAQSGIAERVAGVMAENLGDEDRDTRTLMLDSLRGRFPDPDEPDDPAAPPAPAPPPVPPAPAAGGTGTLPGPQAAPPPGRRPGADPDEQDNNPW
ncbi:YbaB/EbfC family nucleoid-associated protein [Amycolatopsis sp. WQ 127309]|uniref:YbaB/EbfC family nucleoid-associated protein n=1 Tax=Amycolatopsis sp. WQ 127309 TaxID=2932773 RepID=UPI001FF2B3B9|nr:YbaB/EbfC family nucleoid-associated protein [Amycolatopsis sp. WQ 127309]UOZ04778.1 YbaB/EbfC family nucleoid-associated protein [Amycolatopsis sp. WQ 127309]